jgi:hypothetical protein
MGAVAAGLSGDMADVEVDFKCTPLDPFSPGGAVKLGDVFKTQGIEAFAELLITFCEGPLDILEGDTFITGGVTYRVRAVGQWYWAPLGSDYLAILLEEPK